MTWVDVSQWLGGGAFFYGAVVFGGASAIFYEPVYGRFEKENWISNGLLVVALGLSSVGGYLWRVA